MIRYFVPSRYQRRCRINSFWNLISHGEFLSKHIPLKFTSRLYSTATLSAEFDLLPQATTVLKKILNSNNQSVIKSSSLSEDLKLRIYDELSRTNGRLYTTSDLSLALFAFAHGSKDGKQYRLIEMIEEGTAHSVSSLGIGDALCLLTSYCYSSRKHPGELFIL